MMEHRSLSLVQPITLSLSKLSLLQRIASNDNGKRKLEEEAESSIVRKRLRIYDDAGDDDDSSDSSEEETEEEEVCSVELSMKLDTSEEKFLAKRDHSIIFSDDSDTTSPSSEPRTPKSHVLSDSESSDKDDNDNDDDF
jgi:hypothetical protein